MASPVSGPPTRSRVVRKKVGTDDVDVAVDAPLPAAASSTRDRDWSELPLDALASIFGKVGAIEILMGAGLVCRSWLQAAMLPDLWRSVDMAHHKLVYDDEAALLLPVTAPTIDGDLLCAMARVAVDRSCGQLEEFLGHFFVTDELLKYIGDRSPALKAVSLKWCDGVSNEGFTQLIAKCPMLEEIQLSLSFGQHLGGRGVYESIGMACAQLRRFTLSNSDITDDELVAVLDGCPLLELLDLRGCSNIFADDALRARCAGIKSLMLPFNLGGVVQDDLLEYDEKLSSRDCDGDYWDSD